MITLTVIILSNFLLFQILVLPNNINCDYINRDHIKQLLHCLVLPDQPDCSGRSDSWRGWSCLRLSPWCSSRNRSQPPSRTVKSEIKNNNFKYQSFKWNKTLILKYHVLWIKLCYEKTHNQVDVTFKYLKMHFKIICFSWIKTYSEKTHNEANVTCQI